MPVLHPSLAFLIRLQLRAKRRRFVQSLKTPKGVLVALVTVGFLALSLGPAVFMGVFRNSSRSETFLSTAPAFLLAICLIQLLSLKPESGIPFLPPEVDLLFSGPFRRRELLLYKILSQSVTLPVFGLFTSLAVLMSVPNWFYGYLGVVLAMQFVQLFSIGATLIASIVQMRVVSIVRRLVLFGLAVAIFFAYRAASRQTGDTGFVSVLHQFRETKLGMCVMAPFDVFARTMSAQSLPDVLGWASLAVLINFALILLILRLDANFLEASVETSRKLQARLQQIRRGTPAPIALGGFRIKWSVPQLPWLGGAGPNAWRQLVTATRAAGGTLVFLVIVVVAMMAPGYFMHSDSIISFAPLITTFGMMSVFFLPQFICFDFRGDAERIEILKSLPLSPLAVAIGELCVPVVVTTVAEVLLIFGAALFIPEVADKAVIVACFALPLNVLLFGLENLMFLMFPYRANPAAADVSAIGRRSILMLGRMFGVMLGAGVAAGIGGLVFLVSGESWIAAFAAAWLVAAAMGLSVIPLLAWAFKGFDPSRDTIDE